MDALVTYGSEADGTRDLAELVGDTLQARGLRIDVLAVKEIQDLAPYASVALVVRRAGRPRQARRFLRRHRDALARRPTWLFSIGPHERHGVVSRIDRLAERIGVREHVRFEGPPMHDAHTDRPGRRLPDGAERIQRWADRIADELLATRAVGPGISVGQ